MTPRRTVLVPPERVVRWFENFESRHGAFGLVVGKGCLSAAAEDGTLADAWLPLAQEYDGPPEVLAFADASLVPIDWGILLVRKGGFAVASLHGQVTLLSKVGQRHVQGRTKAGGQSQQRFARRRDNQARQAYQAAAEHTHRILVLESSRKVEALVCGGDRSAVGAVLSEPRLEHLAVVRAEPWLDVPDPRRAILDKAVVDARSVAMKITEPTATVPGPRDG